MKRVIIVHGWGGSPEGNWFPWLRGELEKLGVEVTAPAMPKPKAPVLADWLGKLETEIPGVDENTILVGHSLGVMTILRYLESLPEGKGVGGIILVAGFSEEIGIAEIDDFFQTPLDYDKVRNSAKKIVAINSDDDPYVPVEQAEILRDKLGAELIIVPGGKHLNAGSGNFTLPIVLEKLKLLME